MPWRELKVLTRHALFFNDARRLQAVGDNSIDLVVTSPPYPMIRMWDELFCKADPGLKTALENGEGHLAFEKMHLYLDQVWEEVFRVCKEGAFVCINIGDALRAVGGHFQLYANHSRIQRKLSDLGFNLLPVILWRKQTNAPNKFMGSGMLPAGAYVTLEHEYILICRKGGKRAFATAAEKQNRLASAYFWEERNSWYSDLWDLKGARQEIRGENAGERAALFPLLIPYRLINMYSVYGDTILDPFLGTGTTMLAAIAAGRNSVGYEIDPSNLNIIKGRLLEELDEICSLNFKRISDHLKFVEQKEKDNKPLRYLNRIYGFPVMTRQEKELWLPFVKKIKAPAEGMLEVSYYGRELFLGIPWTDLTSANYPATCCL